MCSYKEIIKYILLILKYVIPVFLILLGILKLIFVSNKKKALRRFITYLIGGILIFTLVFVTEFVLKNEFDCIKCTMENNCKEDVIDTPIETPKEEVKVLNEEVKEEPKHKIEEIDGITYVDGYMIVNKTYTLPETYTPVGAEGRERCNECITSETMKAFKEMQADAESLGLNIYISSGYRSYNYQKGLYNGYVSRNGQIEADKYSARPGHSEHQTGLAFDLNTIDDAFALTPEGKWIEQNCYRYGLILRYPKGSTDKTGYEYESWHLRYVGNDLALKLYNDGNWITMEEYFNLTSSYE